MKYYVFKEIQRRLDSLKASTNLDVVFKSVGWAFRGLNSPYTSHQEVDLLDGHGIERTIVLSSNTTHLIISGNNELLVRGCVKAQLPSHLLLQYHLFIFPATAPLWLETSRLVNVIYVDEFRGYSADGAPVFDRKLSDGFIAVRYPHSRGSYIALSVRKMIDPNWAGVGHIFLTDKQLQEEYTKG